MRVIFSSFMALMMSALLLYLTGVIPSFGEWYSLDQSFRLQTEAFLRGELALKSAPYGHRYDWVWGNGIHQIWGLGVPLLRLPFEIIGKLFGSFGFPDRIVFIIFYFFVAAIFWKSLDSVIDSEPTYRERMRKRIQNIPVLFFALLNPALITMIRAKFEPYEEAVAYSYLWTIMLFALILLFLNKPKVWLFLLTCFLAGLSSSIRPTAIFYGTVTFLTVFYFANREQIRFRWLALTLFSLGIVFLMVTNYFRFNSPFEFGQKLLLSGAPVQDYMQRFDNPVEWVSFWSVARELFSALFFTDLRTPYLLDESLLQTGNVPRMREFYFRPYDFLTLIFLLLGWFAMTVSFAWHNKNNFLSKFDEQVIKWGGLWSFCTFVALFYFYSRFYALTSRYFVDFGGSIVIGVVVLYIYINNLIRYKFSHNSSYVLTLILTVAFLGWNLVSLSNAKINTTLFWYLTEAERMNYATAEVAQKRLMKEKQTREVPLPSEYNCGDRESRYGITMNNRGWKVAGDCSVSLTSTHFFINPSCISLYTEPLNEPLEWSANYYSDEEIRAKKGIEYLRRKSDERIGRLKKITFCSKEDVNEDHKSSDIKMISVAWSNLRKHPKMGFPPIKLISIEKGR